MSEELGLAVFAIGAGAATFFSPCAYALLPAYLSYFVTQSEAKPSLSAATSKGLAGAGGALVAFGVLGAIGVIIGQSLMVYFPALEAIVGLALIALGIVLLSTHRFQFSIPLYRPAGSLRSFAAFGAGYAVAGAGCVAPVFLAVVIAAASVPLGVGVLTLTAYAVTFASLLVALTLFGAMGVEVAHGRFRKFGHHLTVLAGIIIIAGGFIQLAIAFGWQPPPF